MVQKIKTEEIGQKGLAILNFLAERGAKVKTRSSIPITFPDISSSQTLSYRSFAHQRKYPAAEEQETLDTSLHLPLALMAWQKRDLVLWHYIQILILHTTD